MLGQGSDEISAFFRALGILEQPFHNPLLGFHTPLPLTVCHLDQALENIPDREWLGSAEREALSLLGFESDISSVAMLVVKSLQG